MMEIILALKLWVDVVPESVKRRVLEDTIEEMERLLRIEAAAKRVATLVLKPGAALPTEQHRDIRIILGTEE